MDAPDSEIKGLALDHYQYYHYKAIFDDQIYKAKLHVSNPITVGILVAGGAPDSGPEHGGATAHFSNPITDCLTRHALLGKITLDNQILDALNHSREISKLASPVSKTVNTFFTEEVIYSLVAGGIILVVILILYGFFDQFIVRKFLCHKRKSEEGNNKHNSDKIKTNDFNSDSQNGEDITLTENIPKNIPKRHDIQEQ